MKRNGTRKFWGWLLLWKGSFYVLSQIGSSWEILASILNVSGKKAHSLPNCQSFHRCVKHLFHTQTYRFAWFLLQTSPSFNTPSILVWQEKASYRAINISELLTLCSPPPCQRKIFKPDQLCDLLYSKSPEARRWWRHEGKEKGSETGISWDCPDIWDMNKAS